MSPSFFLTLIFLTVTCTWAKLPDYVHPCHRNDPRVTKCILQFVETVKPYLDKGIPELNLPSIEPFVFPEIVAANDNTSKAIARNIRIYGLSDFQITNIRVDVPNLTFLVGIKIPFVKAFADIDVDFRILTVPIKGQGEASVNATNIIGIGLFKAKVNKINGTEIAQFTNIDLNIQIDEIDTQIHEDLFDDKILGETINRALHEIKMLMFKIVKPFAQQKLSEILLEYGNDLLKSIDFNEIFPE